MKTRTKYIVAIIILGLHTVVQAQSFISENKQWSIVSHLFETTNYVTTVFEFSGDSVINGQTYYKLYETIDSNLANWKLNSLWYEKNDSVFKFNFISGNDGLIYDFNIGVGDTFAVSELKRLKVDSINFKDWGGSLKKHWYLSHAIIPYQITTVWVEGVGQTGCFLRSTEIEVYGAFVELLCFHENGNLLFQNPKFNSCYVYTKVNDFINNSKTLINILPSNNGKIIINNPNSEIGIIVFYTTEGRQIRRLCIKYQTTQFDLINPGIFIYKFINFKGEAQVGKVLTLH